MSYFYADGARSDILAMIPPDGTEIGSIGCGYAATEAVLVEQGRRVHGVDVEPAAIEVARGRLTTARLIDAGQAEHFAKGSLDGLILADVIEHVPAAWDALRTYAEAIKPGGWAVISVPNMRSLKVFAQFFLRGDWPEDNTGIFDRTHIQVMSRRRLMRWCASAELRPEQWFGIYMSVGWKRALLKATSRILLQSCDEWFLNNIQVRCRKYES